MRIGILGGSFDPVHYGHLEMAKKARKQLYLDEVVFLLSADTPLKNRGLSDYYDRLKMLKIMLKGYRHFSISTLERNSQGKNYTIDTMRKIKKICPNDEIYLIIGGDQAMQFEKWKDADELVKLVHVAYFERKGYTINSKYPFIKLKMNYVDISSSEIREGKLKYTNPKVMNYYYYSNSFDSKFLLNFMSEFRYEHSLSVADLCQKIAHHYRYDEKKAYLMGLFHDLNKENKIISVSDSKIILKHLSPKTLELNEGCWHGVVASYILKHYFKILDSDILVAIENHVLGNSKNTYAKILFVADKLDPKRDYDTSKLLEIVFKDLNKGYNEVKRNQKSFYGEEKMNG